jgi:hypothetical protein
VALVGSFLRPFSKPLIVLRSPCRVLEGHNARAASAGRNQARRAATRWLAGQPERAAPPDRMRDACDALSVAAVSGGQLALSEPQNGSRRQGGRRPC